MKKLIRGMVAMVCSGVFAAATEFPTDVTLTDLTRPDGNITTSFTGNWVKPAKNAFDDGTTHDNTDRTICQTSTADWIYTFDTPTRVNAYRLWCPGAQTYYYQNRMPKTWTFQAKNSTDESWTTLDSQASETGWSAREGRYYEFANFKAYDSYRFAVTAYVGGDGYIQFDELEFFFHDIYGAQPVDCSLRRVSEGQYLFTGAVAQHDATSAKLVFTCGETVVEKDLGPQVKDTPFTAQITTDDGLSDALEYTVKIVTTCETSEVACEQELGEVWLGSVDTGLDYLKRFSVRVPNTVTASLTGFPMLVKISEEGVPGFSYADVFQEGLDIVAVDAENRILPSELQRYTPGGESLLWVRVPAYAAGTEIAICYGKRTQIHLPENAHSVWTDYAGVWHLDEAAAGAVAIADSSDHATGGTGHAKSLVVEGVLGKARGRSDTTGKNGAAMTMPKNDALDALTPEFTVSGWFKATDKADYSYIFSRKNSDAYPSWGWQFRASTMEAIAIYSSGTADNDEQRTGFTQSGQIAVNNWTHYTVAYTATDVALYLNGVLVGTQTIKPAGGAVNGALDFTLGGLNGTGYGTFKGYHDEVRLRKGTVSADWVAAEYAQEKGDVEYEYGAVAMTDASAIVLSKAVLSCDQNGSCTVVVSVEDGVGDVYISYNGDEANRVALGTVSEGASYPVTFTTSPAVPENEIWSVQVVGESLSGTQTVQDVESGILNGVVSVASSGDSTENDCAPVTFTISRPANDAAIAYPLAVNLSWGGTAVAGVNYVNDLPIQVTIPAGEASTTVTMTPLLDLTTEEATTVTLTIVAGPYRTGDSVTATIANLAVPEGVNAWIATEDGNASVAANWSAQRVPTEEDHILVDGRLSQASMTWDAGVNGLSATVASWSQTADYTGTVTVPTMFPSVAGATFTCLTVTGHCEILGGTWTHPQSRTMAESHGNDWDWLGDLKANETYRLRLWAGSLTVGAAARIDVQTKGYYASHDQARLANTAHGGIMSATGQPAYGDPKEPIHIGLPLRTNNNFYNGKGGGAVYLTVDEAAVVNGAICADSGNTGHGAGAAGSVYLKATSVTGTGSISAFGTATGEGNYKGTGGRVAIITKTPVDRSTFAAITAAAEWKNAQNQHAPNCGGAGTVFFKDEDHSNGTLVIAPKADYTLNWTYRDHTTCVSTDGDWTFDVIEFGRHGQLVLPVGAALHLPNGLASCTGTATSMAVCGGLRYEGGTLTLGTAPVQTMTGPWMIFAQSNLTLNANLTLTNGAMIGVPEYGCIVEEGSALPTFPACHITVNGDLSVDATSKLKADNCGFRKNRNDTASGLTGYCSHGGRTAAFGKTKALHYQGYDSVFDPHLPGCTAPQTNGQGAGQTASVLDCTVTGTLTVAGAITANATYTGPATHNNGAGPGGAIKLTVGALAGSGTISANGACNTGSACGGGGRIAVRLTADGATFDAFEGTIVASGRHSSDSNAFNSGSAGTVYLQTASDAEKCGRVIIANRRDSSFGSAVNTNTTEMASLGYDGDAIADYRKVKYEVSDFARAAVNADLQVASVALMTTDAWLDLEGHNLKVGKFTYVTTENDAVVTKKLAPRTYTYAEVSALCDHVVDSTATDESAGTLTVVGNGMVILVR